MFAGSILGTRGEGGMTVPFIFTEWLVCSSIQPSECPLFYCLTTFPPKFNSVLACLSSVWPERGNSRMGYFLVAKHCD